MVDPNLNESAWQRAMQDAERIYKTTTFGVALAIMELLAIPAAVLATVGQEETATQIAVPVLSGALALALAFITVLVVQLAAAPVRQRDELRAAWGEPVKTVNVETTLRNERRKAAGFVTNGHRGPTHTREDKRRAEAWTNSLVNFLSEYVDADAAREFIDAASDTHGFSAQLDAQTAALDRIIDRLSEG